MSKKEKINKFSQATFDGFIDAIIEEYGDIDEYELGKLIGKFFVFMRNYRE